MISLISFPLGVLHTASLPLETLTAMTTLTAGYVRNERPALLAHMLCRYRIPLIHQEDAVRQLAVGYGLSFPDGPETAQVETAVQALSSIGREIEAKHRAMRILARSIYRELTGTGHDPVEIATFADEVVRLSLESE